MNYNIKLPTLILLSIVLMSSCIFKGPDDLSKAKPDFEMTAVQLFEAFEADENSSNEKYLNKIIKITGAISEINDKSVIIGEAMALANCALAENEIAKTKDLKVGQTISIKGSCSGFNMFDVALSKCVIVK